MNEDRQRSINDIAAIVDASYGAVQVILRSDLNIHRIVARFVPDQKDQKVCQDLHQRALDDPTFMSRVITRDETWVYGYDGRRRNSTAARPTAR